MGFSPLAPFRSLIWKNSPPKSCAEKQESDRLQCKKEAVVGGVWLGGTEVGLVIPNQSESNQIQAFCRDWRGALQASAPFLMGNAGIGGVRRIGRRR